MSVEINFNSTTPPAPGGNVNVTWQTDGSGNLAAYVPTSGGGGRQAIQNISAAVTANGAAISGNVLVVASAAPSITLSSIPQTFSRIQIVLNGASDVGSNNTTLELQLNGVTGGDYSYQQMSVTNGTVSGGLGVLVDSLVIGVLPGTGAFGSGQSFGTATIDIPNYASASVYKYFVSTFCAGVDSGLNTNYYVIGGQSYCYFATNTAISSVEIFAASGNLVAGTSIAIYGIN